MQFADLDTPVLYMLFDRLTRSFASAERRAAMARPLTRTWFRPTVPFGGVDLTADAAASLIMAVAIELRRRAPTFDHNFWSPVTEHGQSGYWYDDHGMPIP